MTKTWEGVQDCEEPMTSSSMSSCSGELADDYGAHQESNRAEQVSSCSTGSSVYVAGSFHFPTKAGLDKDLETCIEQVLKALLHAPYASFSWKGCNSTHDESFMKRLFLQRGGP